MFGFYHAVGVVRKRLQQDAVRGDEAMLFITYYEINDSIPTDRRRELAKRLTLSGQFPPEGISIVRWDTSPDVQGIIIMEAEKAEDVTRALDVWRTTAPGFFKLITTTPALPILECMPFHEAGHTSGFCAKYGRVSQVLEKE